MSSNIRINLLREKPKYSSNIGENDFRIYTPGETITEQKDFMRLTKFDLFLRFLIYKFTISF